MQGVQVWGLDQWCMVLPVEVGVMYRCIDVQVGLGVMHDRLMHRCVQG